MSTGLVINHIAPFLSSRHIWMYNMHICRHQYQALLWLPHHTALVLPSCFPYAFHRLASPMGPIISCSAYFISSVQVSLRVHVRKCACLLLSMGERDRRGVRQRKNERESQVTSSSTYLCSSSSVGKVSAVNLSSYSLWVIVCLSGHVGNSVEAVLNNDRIILVYGRTGAQEGVVCPWIPLQSPAQCTLRCFLV